VPKTLPKHPPTDYIAWDEWAEAQLRAGIKQVQCPGCKLWLFPQEKRAHKCEKPITKKGK